MATFEKRSLFPFPAALCWRFHKSPGAFQRLRPPWQSLRVVRTTGDIDAGGDAELLLRGPLGAEITWLARHKDFQDYRDGGGTFTDWQVRGPFRSWEHVHTVRALSPSTCELHDHIRYQLPGGPLSAPFAGGFHRDIERMFAFRHRRTAADCARHAQFSTAGPLRIVVAGASGLIGRELVPFLLNAGHAVDRLVRRLPTHAHTQAAVLSGRELHWDPDRARLDPAHVEGCDAIIHLGGFGVAERRWTDATKRTILESRAASTRLLAQTIAGLKRPPAVFIVASGTGGYPPSSPSDPPVDERTPLHHGFLADVVRAWESAAAPAAARGVRTVHLRMGPVLSAGGGLLGEFAKAVRWGLLRRLGPGTQAVPWIALDDALAAIEFALHTPGLSGPANLAAPAEDTNQTVIAAIARSVRRWPLVPAPAWAVRTLAGEFSQEVLLGRAVRPRRLLDAGFRFHFTNVQDAVGFELGDPRILLPAAALTPPRPAPNPSASPAGSSNPHTH
jgi:hypothetical protein